MSGGTNLIGIYGYGSGQLIPTYGYGKRNPPLPAGLGPAKLRQRLFDTLSIDIHAQVLQESTREILLRSKVLHSAVQSLRIHSSFLAERTQETELMARILVSRELKLSMKSKVDNRKLSKLLRALRAI